MAKTRKKNSKIISVFSNCGIAENNVYKITFSSWIVLIVLRGLNTRRDRNADKFTEEVPKTKGIKEVTTMIKSKKFQPSLKYAPLLKINPKPMIFRLISIA